MIELIGIAGGLMAFGGYLTTVFGDVGLLTHTLNVLSCFLLGYYTYVKKAWVNVGLSLVWLVVALIGMASVI